MNSRRKLKQSLTVLALTVALLSAVTMAWFVNWTTPLMERLNFASPALNVDVSITDEEGNTVPSADGSAKLIAENMKPGDNLIYEVKVQNKGASCKVYLGLSDLKNYVLSVDGATAVAAYVPYDPAAHGPDRRFSDMLRVSIWEKLKPPPPAGTPQYQEAPGAFRFIGDAESFFFSQGFSLEEGALLELQYRIQFVGIANTSTGANPTGAAAGNSYAQKKVEGMFAVSATLAN